METPVDDPARVAALRAVRNSFYGGELPAAVSAGMAMLAGIDSRTGNAAEHAWRARVLLWLVRCGRRADALDTALGHAYAGMAAAQASGDGQLACLLQAQYVHVLASLGQNETALSEGYKLLRRATDSGDTHAQAASWLALGHVHWTMQQWRDGDAAYTQAQTLARICGDKEISGLASNGIAAMEDHYATEARTAGRADEALAHALRSSGRLEEFTGSSLEIGDAYNAWVGKYNQACCLFGMGQNQAARDLLNKQLAALGDERGSRRQLIVQVLGDIHLADGRPDLAIACQAEAMEIAERLQLPMLAMDACRSMVAALERSGDYRSALAQHQRYHALYVQLASNKAQAHARAMAVIYETEKTRALADAQRRRADQLASVNNSLTQEKAVLQRNSLEDALTGLANRRRFDDELAKALKPSRARRSAVPTLALALLDVDHFKRVNDRFSHLVGDEVLRRLGALLQLCCRKQDVAARYGGEEFALILADVDPALAHATCERLRAAVEAGPWSDVHPELLVTVSIGVVHAAELAAQAGASPHDLLTMADSRLYAAKRGGRNQVVGASARTGVGATRSGAAHKGDCTSAKPGSAVNAGGRPSLRCAQVEDA